MTEPIITEELPNLAPKNYDIKKGVYVEFPNHHEARVDFARVMQGRGYRLDANRTWLKARRAAVVEPR